MTHTASGVLVVDDDPDIRTILSDFLTDEGYLVRTAVHGRQALDLLSGWCPAGILLDLMMPIMDGRTFLITQRMSPELCRIPVMVMSASHTLTGGDEWPTVADVLAKPFEIDELLTKVSALVRRSSASE
jgi:DNA-binding response OmpR family regulator